MKVKLRIKVDEVQAHQQLLSKALLTCSAGSQSGHEHESPTRSNLTHSDDELITLRLVEALSIASVSWILHLGLIADVIHATSQVLS